MKEEIISLDKNITFFFKKQKETRNLINTLDNLYKRNHAIDENKNIPEDSEYIKQRAPLNIILQCYAIKSDIAISQKHLLLSTQDQEHIYFTKLLCMTINSGIDLINSNMSYLNSNLETNDIELFKSKLKKIHKYKDILVYIRNHSVAHTDPQFTTYYDSMLNISKIPFYDVVNNFIESIQTLENMSYKINKRQLEENSKKLKEIIRHSMEIIENDENLSNKNELFNLYEEFSHTFNIK